MEELSSSSLPWCIHNNIILQTFGLDKILNIHQKVMVHIYAVSLDILGITEEIISNATESHRTVSPV